MRKFTFPLILLAAIGVLITVFILGRGKQSGSTDPNLVSRAGFHWHPELKVFVKGKEQQIPQNIGINGTQMAEVHTHADLPKIHYEMTGPVYKDEITLGAFFKSWGETYSGEVKVIVNGKQTSESFNYQVKDGDQIEVHYG